MFFALTVSQVSARDLSDTVEISTIEYPSLFQSKPTPGVGYGAARDLTDAAFHRVGMATRYTFLPMVRSVESVMNRRFDANLGSANWFVQSGHFDQVVSETLLYINFKLFYRKSRFPKGVGFDTFSDLNDYRIGNVRGSSTTPVVKRLALKIDWISSLELNFRKLMAGRVDFAISGELAGWDQLEKLFPGQRDEFATIPVPIHIVPISVVFHKDESEVAARFRKGLDLLIDDGTYEQIVSRYYTNTEARESALLDILR